MTTETWVPAAHGLTWVIQNHGWRSALWVVAGVGVVWAAAWFVCGADGRYRDAEADAGAGAGAAQAPASAKSRAWPAYRRVFASRTWIGTTLAYFTSYWCVALMLVWMPSYLKNGLGHSSATAGTLVALPWALGAVVLLGQAALTGWLMRRGVGSRWARGRVGAGLLFLGAVCCLAVPLADGTGAKTALLVVGCGLGGSFATVAITTVAELAPAARRGGALGTMNAVVTTTGLIAPTLVGRMVDSQGTSGYQHAVALSAVLLLLGAVAAFTLIDPARDAARTSA
ncbi:MFS transporter [Streptomyces sp. NPDC051742]|uniref:MFS transporter n=1 Tax=unclassified Streptomyces TaxID=2593676 RepID=UPI003420D856